MPLLFLKKDFWAGVMLIACGALAMYLARTYTFGNALRMGPGYFPIVLGGLLILFGLYILATSLRSEEKLSGNWSLRALVIVPLSLALFGILMDPPEAIMGYVPSGFVPAMMVLIFGSATASTEFRFVEVLLFSVFLTALSAAVFIYGLGLPYPLFGDLF
jgi:uncharacterized membrane protein